VKQEQVHTSLRFVGEWPWWTGVGAALLLGVAAWLFYRRDVRRLGPTLRWLLPTLRALVIIMLVLMLSGPVLHHRKVIGQLSRLLLFVDSSQSMDLTDSAMDIGRKIRIVSRAGMLPEGAVQTELPLAGEALAAAQAVAEKARAAQNATVDETKKATEQFAARTSEARILVEKAANDGDRLARFDRDLQKPAAELAARELRQIDGRSRAVEELTKLGAVASAWQKELADLFQKQMQASAESGNSAVTAALQRFDALPRWQRLQSILLEGESQKLLSQLAESYDVQLITLEGSEPKILWQPSQSEAALPAGLPKPSSVRTNLAAGLRSAAGDEATEQRGAVVLFSDGQHNEGESPLEVAKLFGARGMPLYTVGIGGEGRPPDLALLSVEAPDAVFYQDRVRGQITLKDDMAPGQPFTVSIRSGDKVVWEQALTTENKQSRQVAFDFPVTELVEARAAERTGAGMQITGVPVELQVGISSVAGDREPGNNEGSLRFRAITQKRKILIMDGRPRWETRYVRNLFERDEQWEVNAVVLNAAESADALPRGEKTGSFPASAAELSAYDLIIFGEVPRTVFQGEELQWINDFVAQRGGAVLFIDGARGRLKEYADTPLEPLFPVTWNEPAIRQGITSMALPPPSVALAAYAITADRTQNAETWSTLRAPHWLSGATPLPGAETLLEAEVSGKKVAAAVHRPFGAGRVLYHGFDESWRWRFDVADQIHVKFWHQMAGWLAELPFAVRDKFVSLDAGAITYEPGATADLRVRLRDGEGKPVTNAAVAGVLYRDGLKVATIPLSPDENTGGLFRGRTVALEPGDYEVGVQSVAIPESELRARVRFKVTPHRTTELTELGLNEDLLRQMAAAGGGEYLREENVDRLPQLLAPMSEGKVIEADTVLWQSFWWFLPIIGLLTAEWIIRKRAGLL
jgi:hypothetical protein